MLAVSIAPVDYPARADIRRLIGEVEWFSLPAAVRSRFGEHAADAQYRGTFDEVRASFAGKLLATCCRLLGTPVAPFTGTNVPTTVNAFATPDGGIAWQRIYHFPGRKPCIVESIKRLSREGTLVEALPAGMRMALDVYARDGVLHFVSTGYYFELGGLRLRLPEWLPPGVTHVQHIDLGDGTFRFTMSVRHRWLGQVFWQSGRFRDPVPGEKIRENSAPQQTYGCCTAQFPPVFSPGTAINQSLNRARALAPSNVRRTASIACSVARSRWPKKPSQ
ncbi:MAG TPA: DUF4166 domain-containing protein [Steroidobacteraceae bacterium]|jgi:hypothetical protein